MITVYGKGPSSKRLAQALGVRRNRQAPVVIRWKTTDPLPPRWGKVKEFNSSAAVRRASNKLMTLQILREAGVAVPPFAERYQDLPVSKGDVVFGRLRYHSKGMDIIAKKEGDNPEYFHAVSGQHVTKEQFLTKEYFVKWLPSHSEYRYHVAFGKVILCTKKILDNEGGDVVHYVRNHQGGKWRQVTCEETPRFSEACIKAVSTLGLQFGAVDFLNVKKQAVILEVNTAPGLEVDNRLDAYAAAFKQALEG